MLAMNEARKRKLKKVLMVTGIFILGILSAKYIPTNIGKKNNSDRALVEKISDDSLKLSDETIKNLKISQVVTGEVPEELSIMGKISVAEDRTAMVAARVAGRIDSINVSSGAVLKAGEKLATLFSPDFVIAREEYLQTLAQVKATDDPEEKKVLGLSFQKLQTMGVSKYDIEHLDETDKTSHLVIRAPRAGAVIDKKAVIGNLVNPGDPLFTIGDMTSIWFAGDIYPADLNKVHKGQDVVIDSEVNGTPIHGKLSFISPMVDATTRTIKVRAEMENPGNALRLDMYVKGNLILSQKKAMTIPKGALVREGNSFICFKEFPNHIFKRVPVETTGESGDSVIVTKGLETGDQVVSEGALLLTSALSTSSANSDE
jgi:Cu(I)/Ag(I) efflux system membrane fusion protein